MSSATNNIPQTAPNQPTRRQFLKALAILPAAALPTLPTLSFDKVEAPTFHTGLTDLIIKLAAFDAYLHALASKARPVDAEALYQRYGEASESTQELDRLLLSVEFEQTVLGPLAGGIERYHAALAIEPAEAIAPVKPGPEYQNTPKPSPEKLREAYEAMESVIADLKAKLG
jgi:hypothetical protein